MSLHEFRYCEGWAVVVPDHQGPDSAYAAGPLAGRITLDGIRATASFAPMQLSGNETRVGIRMGRAVPDMPMFLYQANPDWLIPVGPVNDLVDTYAKDPTARIEYVRDHFSEHLTLDPIAAPRALLWLKDRFAGKPVAVGTSITDVGSMTLDPATWQVWGETVGTTLAAVFQQPIGTGR